MPSIDGSAWIFDSIVASEPDRSVLSTWRFVSVPVKVDLAPAQRCSRPTLPASWMTQSAFFTPASLSCSPAALPASVSLWPTWVIAPNSCHWSRPELMVMTGTPAATAALMLFSRPSGLAIETTRPSVPAATALSIRVACLPTSGSDW